MQETVKLKVKRIMEEAILPTYAHEGDAGADLYTISNAVLYPGDIAPLYTGLAVAIPQGFRLDIKPRSGLACKNQLLIPNSPGTIDASYRGHLLVYLKNIGKITVNIKEGDRIAQIMLERVIHINFEEVDTLDETSRGGGGFGSTGM